MKITRQQFIELFKTVENAGEAYDLIAGYVAVKSFRYNYRQKLLLERISVAAEFGKMNKSCGSCIARHLNKIIGYCQTYKPILDPTPKANVTKKKVKAAAPKTPLKPKAKKKAEAPVKITETKVDPDGDEFLVITHSKSYLKVKAYAQRKLNKKYPKGTTLKEIKKDLGIE